MNEVSSKWTSFNVQTVINDVPYWITKTGFLQSIINNILCESEAVELFFTEVVTSTSLYTAQY